jgi:geranylgeranyl diphosphate synthase, type II
MLSIALAQKIIAKEFEKINFADTPADLYDPVRYILSLGGKRMRPVLVLLGCDLFGKDYMKAVGPALGIEVFHNFTLLHDDLMDNSDVRRKHETVHVKWNPNVAILSGDVMSILANQFVTQVEKHVLSEVLALFNNTAIKVCEGQMMDMNFEQEKDVSLQSYFKMIGLKTSALIAASLKMGSIIADTSLHDRESIYEYGYNLGQAFQLQDDLLDIYGEEQSFGKKIGNDIVANKKTFLLIKALEIAQGDTLKNLKTLISNTSIVAEEKIKAVMKIFDDLNIRFITENKVNEFFEIASEKLDSVNVDRDRKKVLMEFSNLLIKRNH